MNEPTNHPIKRLPSIPSTDDNTTSRAFQSVSVEMPKVQADANIWSCVQDNQMSHFKNQVQTTKACDRTRPKKNLKARDTSQKFTSQRTNISAVTKKYVRGLKLANLGFEEVRV